MDPSSAVGSIDATTWRRHAGATVPTRSSQAAGPTTPTFVGADVCQGAQRRSRRRGGSSSWDGVPQRYDGPSIAGSSPRPRGPVEQVTLRLSSHCVVASSLDLAELAERREPRFRRMADLRPPGVQSCGAALLLQRPTGNAAEAVSCGLRRPARDRHRRGRRGHCPGAGGRGRDRRRRHRSRPCRPAGRRGR